MKYINPFKSRLKGLIVFIDIPENNIIDTLKNGVKVAKIGNIYYYLYKDFMISERKQNKRSFDMKNIKDKILINFCQWFRPIYDSKIYWDFDKKLFRKDKEYFNNFLDYDN